MTIDQQIATKLGFPKPEYTAVERERRWLCREVPRELIRRTEAITDLYVSGTRLRLREARPTDGGAPMLRLTRKADADKHTRLITSIYLPEDEFSVLAASLVGSRIRKLRHRLHSPPGVMLLVDEFRDALEGLFIAEAEFKTQEQLDAFSTPGFAACEVTDDPRFTGGHLVKGGLPPDLPELIER
jgi:CYTH domain-containing protein